MANKYPKPKKKYTIWNGKPGNKFRVYCVSVNGKKYCHGENKLSRDRQYDSAQRLYVKRKIKN